MVILLAASLVVALASGCLRLAYLPWLHQQKSKGHITEARAKRYEVTYVKMLE